MQRTPHRGRACRTCGKRPAGYAEALPRRGRTSVSERGVFIKGAAAAPSRHQLLGSREAAEPRAPSAPPASSSGAEPAPTKGPQPAATANHAAETDAPSPAPENRSCGRGDRRAQSPPRRGSMRHPTERRAQSKSRGKSREKSRGKVNRGPKCPSLGCQALRPCRSRRTSERPRALPCKLPLMCPARYRPVLPRPPQRSRRNHPHTPAPGTRRCASAADERRKKRQQQKQSSQGVTLREVRHNAPIVQSARRLSSAECACFCPQRAAFGSASLAPTARGNLLPSRGPSPSRREGFLPERTPHTGGYTTFRRAHPPVGELVPLSARACGRLAARQCVSYFADGSFFMKMAHFL